MPGQTVRQSAKSERDNWHTSDSKTERDRKEEQASD